MLSSYYPTNPDEGSETSIQSSCGANIQPYWSNSEMNPWMTSDLHPSMIGGGIASDGQFNNTTMSHNNCWDQAIPTSAPDQHQAWATPYDNGYGHGSMNQYNHNQNHTYIQTSRDVSPNEDYFGTIDYSNYNNSNNNHAVSPAASWDLNNEMDQPMFSPYSEVPPQIAGLSNSTNMNISPMNPPQYPYSSAPQATTMSTSPPTHHTAGAAHNRQQPSSTSGKQPPSKSRASKTSSSKPGSSSGNKRKASSSSSSSAKHSREQSKSNKMQAPQEVHRIASEQISREAWRICKAEAIEMEQRRVQLLQNGSGKLEQELLEQRHNLSLIRQGVMREQGVLEEALRRAEELGRA